MFKKEINNFQRKKVLWEEMLRQDFVKAQKSEAVVIIPVGSIEQHGPHCPVDVDINIVSLLAQKAAVYINEFPVIVAPSIYFGIAHYNKGFPGTICLSLEVFIDLISEVCRCIFYNGFKKIILLNGHGGNNHALKAIAIKLAEENIYVLAFNHWELLENELKEWSETDEGSIGHAGEWETSLQLYFRPQLIDCSYKNIPAESIKSTKLDSDFNFLSFPERQEETISGVMGNPNAASREKGERYASLATTKLIKVIKSYHSQEVRQYIWRKK